MICGLEVGFGCLTFGWVDSMLRKLKCARNCVRVWILVGVLVLDLMRGKRGKAQLTIPHTTLVPSVLDQ